MTAPASGLRHPGWIAAILLLGLLASAAMVVRSQTAGDQLNLLALGWRLAEDGVWVPHGNPTSGGGVTPGGATAVFVGLPLLVWRDHRAATAIVLLSHLVAYLLLDRLVRRLLGPEARLLFAVLYWLNPWRLYHSAFLWNPNYLFLAGALHLWTVWRQRDRARFWPSFVHVLSLGVALQLEIVALPLVVATLLLWWRGYFRLHLGGAVAAAAVVAASLVPWALLVLGDPALWPREEGFLGRGLVHVYPLYRGIHYWVRYSSLALSTEIFCLDFSSLLGTAAMARLSPLMEAAEKVVYFSTVPFAVWANYRLWRGSGRWWAPADPVTGDREWLSGVVRWSFMAGVIVFCLSPTNIMRWHVLSLFHLAVMPLVLAAGPLLRRRRGGAATAAWTWGALSALLALAILAGSPAYRCGGDRCNLRAVTQSPLVFDHPMLEELGIQRTCRWEVCAGEGFWPLALPEDPAACPP